MQGFVKEKEFYKQAACIAIPISLQSVITIGVSMMDIILWSGHWARQHCRPWHLQISSLVFIRSAVWESEWEPVC